jgi:peptide/nickel transport system permease protein
MLTIVVRRLLISLPLLFVVSVLTFVLASLVPGDPAAALLGVNATPEQFAALRAALHLNQPLVVQYGLYLQSVLHADLGRSIFTDEPVLQSIGERLPVTLALIIGATVIAATIGVVLGVVSATRGRIARRVVDVVSLLGNALPNFWVALVLVAIFAIGLGAFPATGWTAFEDSPSLWLSSLVLPVVALSLGGIAVIAKVTRDGMLTNLSLDYVRHSAHPASASVRSSGAMRSETPEPRW